MSLSGSLLDVAYEATRGIGRKDDGGVDVKLAYSLPAGMQAMCNANVQGTKSARLNTVSVFHVAGPINVQPTYVVDSKRVRLKFGRGSTRLRCPISFQTEFTPGGERANTDYVIGLRQHLGYLRTLRARLFLPAGTATSFWCEYMDQAIDKEAAWFAKMELPFEDKGHKFSGKMLRALKERILALSDACFGNVYCGTFGPIVYLCTWPCAELYFHFLCKRFIEKRMHSQHATFHALTDPAEAQRFWERQLAEAPESLMSTLREWFLPNDPKQPMCRENVVEFLVWNMHNVALKSADAWQRATAEALCDRIDAAVGPMPTGYNPHLRCLTYTLEPWPKCQKPLFAYLLIAIGRRLLGLFLRYHGFELHTVGRLEYWARDARETFQRPRPPPPSPLVLLHGVLGLIPYALLLRQLANDHEGAILAPIFPHCSIQLEHLCSLTPPPHDAQELVSALHTMVARHAPQDQRIQAAFIAHSLGTSYLAMICRQSPGLVTACAFIDPICFLLPDGRVLRNYLIEPVCLGLATWFHWLQRYIVADEPTQQDFFRNVFWWSSAWLHPSELPCDAVVLLSGRDSVAHAPRVFTHLKAWQCWTQLVTRDAASPEPELPPSPSSPPSSPSARRAAARVEIKMHARWSHGWIMFHPTEQRALVHKIQQLASRAEDNRRELAVPPTPLTSNVLRAPSNAYEAKLDSRARLASRRVRFSWEEDEGDTASQSSSDIASVDETQLAPAASPTTTMRRMQGPGDTMWLQLTSA